MHCWVQPVRFDGARWNLPRSKQFDDSHTPGNWKGTGVMTRLSAHRARYVDAGGAELVLFPANSPSVSLDGRVCL
jgi:hypothetical protein